MNEDFPPPAGPSATVPTASTTGPTRRFTVTTPDGATLAAQVMGPASAPESAPPLLLLPGQANSHHWWDAVRPGYAAAFRTITFDYRGTGDSARPGRTGAVGEPGPAGRSAGHSSRPAWSMRTFAEDAAGVLAAAGYSTSPVAVFGTSMGGRVAQELALLRPDLVGALVLACTGPGGAHEVRSPAEVGHRLLEASGADKRRVLFELFYSPAWPGEPAESTLLGDPGMTAAARSAHLRASRRHDAWERLPRIGVPTLVLHGEEDLMCPVDNARVLAERIPGARVRTYPQGRHGFFEEFSARVTPDVVEFLAGCNLAGCNADAPARRYL
jgi:3-oxoadipate enol-lactonase